jgi:undecaprenyl diphosphate synthase
MSVKKALAKKGYGFYERRLRKKVLQEKVPNHVAIIMDGNRRYAEDEGMDINEGHARGKEKLEEVIDWCHSIGVKILTVYAFSTENFSRPEEEVKYIMEMLETTFFAFAEDERIHENKVALRVIGDRSIIPGSLMQAVEHAEARTAGYTNFHLNVAVAYGGRQEIISAVKRIAEEVKNDELRIDDIDEQSVSDRLYTYDLPDPDLILRTSGEVRISNFLLWQLAYSEFYFSDVYWPGFRCTDFLRAIRAYQQRFRRFGH